MPVRSYSDLHVYVARDRLLIDEPLELVASGCEPGTSVEIEATMETTEVTVRSSAVLVAQADGTVDIAKDASVGGSYSGVDPYGLWWSAAPIAAPDPQSATPLAWRVRIRANGLSREHAVHRSWSAPGVMLEEVRERGVVGLFARPARRGPFPGVIAFGGSAGGLVGAIQWAPLLASRGFATLALACFGAPGLPGQLVAIEVETVERAIRWLDRRSEVSGDRVAVIGGSRGGELALLAGSLLDRIAAVVAFAPSHVSWAGLDARGPVDAPAWTFRGQPIPYAPTGPDPSSHRDPSTGGIVLRSAFAAVLEDPGSCGAAEIPIERISGPILLVSGEDDHFWPSTVMADLAIRRARERGFEHNLTHLRYPGAGHNCAGVPGIPLSSWIEHPLTGGRYSFGGTPATNARARIDSWPRVIAFLRTTLPVTSDPAGAPAGVAAEVLR
jgi:dienelactone hydrolase